MKLTRSFKNLPTVHVPAADPNQNLTDLSMDVFVTTVSRWFEHCYPPEYGIAVDLHTSLGVYFFFFLPKPASW